MELEWVNDYFQGEDFVQVDKDNNPTISDKATTVDVLGAFFNSIAGSTRHGPETTVGTTDEAVRRAIVTYTRRDGSEVPLPVSSYRHRKVDGNIDKHWIYIDTNPLYAEEGAQ